MVELEFKRIDMYGCRSKHETWRKAHKHRSRQSVANNIKQTCEHVTLIINLELKEA